VFDVPNSLSTAALSINDGGDVTGGAAISPGKVNGFVRYRDGSIIVFDVPNSWYTGAKSINFGGDVTGFINGESRSHAFVRYRDGSIIVFDPPASVSAGAFSINTGGDVTGYYQYGSGDIIRGFVRYQNGNIVPFDAPNSSSTYAYDINDSGVVTGCFSDPTLMPDSPYGGKVRGFVRDRRGVINIFDVPDAAYTTAFSINARGDTAGFFMDADNRQLGFLRRRSPTESNPAPFPTPK
jgi:hypothetical protein